MQPAINLAISCSVRERAPRQFARAHTNLGQLALDRTARAYPREVARRAFELDAAAVILSHNHQSGVAAPSRADEYVTQSLKSALSLIDVRTLDHVIVAGLDTFSFAERGLM